MTRRLIGTLAARRPAALALLLMALAVRQVAGAPADGSLIQAVREGDIDAVRMLVRTGADPNATASDGSTPLHWAAHRNSVEMADVLMRAGADVRAASRYGLTPLWLACVNGSGAMVERFLLAGADPNTRMAEGDTALMTAARSGSVAAVRTLLEYGAEVDARESWKGQTALMWAASRDNTEVVHALVNGGADIHLRTKYKPPAQPSIGKTRGRGLNLDVTAASGFTAFLFAVRAGAIDSARLLLKAGASVDERLGDGTSALVLAIGSTRYDLAAVLLDQGADPNAAAQGWTPLHQIVWTRRPNTGSNNPWPVERDRIDSLSFARRLVAGGADVNAAITRDADISVIGRRRYSDVGATPLWIASETLDLPMMRLLVEHGADIDHANDIGTTPLLAAAGVGIEMPGENPGSPRLVSEAVSFLLARGADATRVDRHGETALHGAALWGSDDAVRTLAMAGARLDAVNECGWLPWHVATGVAYDGNVIGQHPSTADLLRRMMEERGTWKTPPPAAPC